MQIVREKMTSQLEKGAKDRNKQFIEIYPISLVIKCILKKCKSKYNILAI